MRSNFSISEATFGHAFKTNYYPTPIMCVCIVMCIMCILNLIYTCIVYKNKCGAVLQCTVTILIKENNDINVITIRYEYYISNVCIIINYSQTIMAIIVFLILIFSTVRWHMQLTNHIRHFVIKFLP